jgi:hypothetical protein
MAFGERGERRPVARFRAVEPAAMATPRRGPPQCDHATRSLDVVVVKSLTDVGVRSCFTCGHSFISKRPGDTAVQLAKKCGKLATLLA